MNVLIVSDEELNGVVAVRYTYILDLESKIQLELYAPQMLEALE
jgi:hypothetical protein